MHNASIPATEFACLKCALEFSASVFFQEKKIFLVLRNVERGAGAQLPIHSFWLNSLRLLRALHVRIGMHGAHTHIHTHGCPIIQHIYVFVCDACVWHTTSIWRQRRRLTIVLLLNCASAKGTQIEKPVFSLKSWNAQQIHCRNHTDYERWVLRSTYVFVVALLLFISFAATLNSNERAEKTCVFFCILCTDYHFPVAFHSMA